VPQQEAAKLYLFGGHCVEMIDKAEKETVFNDLWQLDLNTFQVPYEQHHQATIHVVSSSKAA
jgi:hypothetical protein